MNKEQFIENYVKNYKHERYLKNKKNIEKWREANKERYNEYRRNYQKNYIRRKAEEEYQRLYNAK